MSLFGSPVKTDKQELLDKTHKIINMGIKLKAINDKFVSLNTLPLEEDTKIKIIDFIKNNIKKEDFVLEQPDDQTFSNKLLKSLPNELKQKKRILYFFQNNIFLFIIFIN